MKKIVLIIVAIFLLPIIFSGCSTNIKSNSTEYNVNIILDKNGEIEQHLLTNRVAGDSIYNPFDYYVTDSILSDFVVINDSWYNDSNCTCEMFFPYTMPNHELNIYAKVRTLSSITNISLNNSSNIASYFSTQCDLKDEYLLEPSLTSKTSYYEIAEYSVANIKNYFRYYPATEKLILSRGYSINQRIAGGIYVQDEFSAGVSIDFSTKEMKFIGLYKRGGINVNSGYTTGGDISIEFDIKYLSIDINNEPLTPNFSTINYSSNISNTTNYSKTSELWNEEGNNFSNKCYSQINTLLKAISKRVIIFNSK